MKPSPGPLDNLQHQFMGQYILMKESKPINYVKDKKQTNKL